MGSSVATSLRKIEGCTGTSTRTIGVGTYSALYISLEYSYICYKEKKSGKWRLLHDLREINKQMILMGPVQRGLPLSSALPRNWPIIVLDIKDCFFSLFLYIIKIQSGLLLLFLLKIMLNLIRDLNGRFCHREWQTVLLCVNYMLIQL